MVTHGDGLVTQKVTNELLSLPDIYGKVTKVTNHLEKKVNYRKRGKGSILMRSVYTIHVGLLFVSPSLFLQIAAFGSSPVRHPFVTPKEVLRSMRYLVEHKKRLTHLERATYMSLCGKLWLRGGQSYSTGHRVKTTSSAFPMCRACTEAVYAG